MAPQLYLVTPQGSMELIEIIFYLLLLSSHKAPDKMGKDLLINEFEKRLFMHSRLTFQKQ